MTIGVDDEVKDDLAGGADPGHHARVDVGGGAETRGMLDNLDGLGDKGRAAPVPVSPVMVT